MARLIPNPDGALVASRHQSMCSHLLVCLPDADDALALWLDGECCSGCFPLSVGARSRFLVFWFACLMLTACDSLSLSNNQEEHDFNADGALVTTRSHTMCDVVC